MNPLHPWFERRAHGYLEGPLDGTLRVLVAAHLTHHRMSRRTFSLKAKGPPGFIAPWLRGKRSMQVDNADRVLGAMGEAPFGAPALAELFTFAEINGIKFSKLGEMAFNDPSFLWRFRDGACPVLRTLSQGWLWMAAHVTHGQPRRLREAGIAAANEAGAGIAAAPVPLNGVSPAVDQPDIFDTPGAAAYLGKSPRTLEGLRYRGEGPPYVKVGGTVRYVRSAVDRWLEQQMTDGPGGKR